MASRLSKHIESGQRKVIMSEEKKYPNITDEALRKYFNELDPVITEFAEALDTALGEISEIKLQNIEALAVIVILRQEIDDLKDRLQAALMKPQWKRRQKL